MNRRLPSLDERLGELPRSVEPPTDLWPGIEAKIRPIRRWRLPAGLAAGLGLAVMAGAALVGWTLLRPTAVTRPVAVAPAEHSAPPVFEVSFAPPAQPAYRNARADAERLFHERLSVLQPATRAKIEANLTIIQKADADIRRALESDPGSPVLLQLLESTQHQEFDLYTTVARNTEPVMMRSGL